MTIIFLLQCLQAYWMEGRDMEEHSELQSVADKVLPGIDVAKMVVESNCSQRLKENTQEAASRGVFGVPRYYYYFVVVL